MKELRKSVDNIALGDRIVWGGATNDLATVVEIDPDAIGRFRIEWESTIMGNEGKSYDAWLSWNQGEDINVWAGE